MAPNVERAVERPYSPTREVPQGTPNRATSPEAAGPSPLVVVMGVTGVGKTTVGRAVAERLGWAFVDGDDHHPQSNVAKMARGEPLGDADRFPWLVDLHKVVDAHRSAGTPLVLACSALKERYRKILAGEQPGIVFVHLRGDTPLLVSRIARRRGHFVSAVLLESQLQDLQPPSDAIEVSVDQPVDSVVQSIVDALNRVPPGTV